MISLSVPDGYPKQKLRYFLASHAKISSTLWRKIKWHGDIRINNIPVQAAAAFVQSGDTVSYELSEASTIIPCYRYLDIIYEDDWLLVVNKPADMIIHPTNKISSDTLVNIIAGYYEKTKQKAGCHPVYRLDRNTTGLIIIAKQPQIQYYLAAAHDRITRLYLAIAEGAPRPAEAMLCSPIGRKEGSIIERTVKSYGQAALTRYKILRKLKNYSLLELKLYSGRTHQIRVHMAYDGHPLLGDDLYGGDCSLISRQALHAYKVSFIHPISGQKLSFNVPLPEDMLKLL